MTFMLLHRRRGNRPKSYLSYCLQRALFIEEYAFRDKKDRKAKIFLGWVYSHMIQKFRLKFIWGSWGQAKCTFLGSLIAFQKICLSSLDRWRIHLWRRLKQRVLWAKGGAHFWILCKLLWWGHCGIWSSNLRAGMNAMFFHNY